MDERGLYYKYNVQRTRDGNWETEFTFTLVPTKDPTAVEALLHYAEYTDNSKLAADIFAKLQELGLYNV